MKEKIVKKDGKQSKRCIRCKQRFVVNEVATISVEERDAVGYGEQLHLGYTFVRCPYCGEPVFMGTSGRSLSSIIFMLKLMCSKCICEYKLFNEFCYFCSYKIFSL